MADLLLAKSEPQIALKKHEMDGLEIWKQLQVSFPLAQKISAKDNFWWLLRLAIITHDLGKAHSEFQKILKGENSLWRKQRHELFSLPFVAKLPLEEEDKKYVLRVVAAHHKNYKWLRKFISSNYELHDPDEFKKEFEKVNVSGGVQIANELEPDILPYDISTIVPGEIIRDFMKEARKLDGDNSVFFFLKFY